MLGLARTMFTNKVFTDSVHELHPNQNMNMFTNMDNPGVALVNPHFLLNLDRVLLMQPICSIDLVHMNIYKNKKIYTCT